MRPFGWLTLLWIATAPAGTTVEAQAPRTRAGPARTSQRAPVRARRWGSKPGASRRAARLPRHETELVSPESYRQLAGATRELLVSFPPERYFYAGIGRSPSALVEMLQAIVPHQAQGLPASGLSKRAGRQITAAEYAEYERHLDHFFPHRDRLEGRTLLLMDSVVDGGTLQKMKEIFERYVGERGIDARVETLSIRGPHASTEHALSELHDPTAVGTDAIARYDSHVIGLETLEELRPNPDRTAFVRALLAHMSEDRQLDTFIASGFKPVFELEPAPQKESLGAISTPKHESPTEPRSHALAASLRRGLEERFEDVTFLRASGEPASGSLTIRMEPRYPHGQPPSWSVTSEAPAFAWGSRLGALEPAIAAFTQLDGATRSHSSLEIRLHLDGDGRLSAQKGVSIVRRPRHVELADEPSSTGRLTLSSRRPEARHTAEDAEELLARAFSGMIFEGPDGAIPTERTVRIDLRPRRDTATQELFRVRTRLENEAWRRPLESIESVLEQLSRNSRNPDHRFAVSIELTLDGRGMLEPDGVSVRPQSRVIDLQDEATERGTIELVQPEWHTPSPPAPDEVPVVLARAFHGLAFRDASGRAPRTVSIELQPTRDWMGRDALSVRTSVPDEGWSRPLADKEDMFDHLTAYEGSPHRGAVEITLSPDASGEVAGPRAVSVRRIAHRVATTEATKEATVLWQDEARGDASASSPQDLASQLVERLSPLSFHGEEPGQRALVAFEVHPEMLSNGRKLLRVYSTLPEHIAEKTVEGLEKGLARLTGSEETSSSRPVRLEVSLDEHGRPQDASFGAARLP